MLANACIIEANRFLNFQQQEYMQHQTQQKHYTIYLVGLPKVGKSFLVQTLLEDIPQYIPHKYEPSVSFSRQSKQLVIQQTPITLQIIDSPGGAFFETLRLSHYKQSDLIMFVFDINGWESFEWIQKQVRMIVQKQLVKYDCAAMLIGIDKEDSSKNRMVKYEDAQMLGGIIGNYVEIKVTKEKNKIFQIFNQAAQTRLKFDQQNPDAKSMLQSIYQNLQNPPLAQFKEQFFKPKHQVQKVQESNQSNEVAAPGQVPKPKKQDPNIIKLLLLGQSNVGKTAIMQNYFDGSFLQSHIPTIGIDFRVGPYSVSDKTYKLQCWDTAGLSKFRVITQSYYKLGSICLIVYDVTNLQSFQKCENLIEKFMQFNQVKVKYVCLVGNKIDLENERVVSGQMGANLAQKHKIDFAEISAKNQEDIKCLFAKGMKFVTETETI